MSDERKPFTLPWTPAEIAELVQYQRSGRWHPYTCNGGLLPREHRHDHEVKLEPTAYGLRCPECKRLQTWL